MSARPVDPVWLDRQDSIEIMVAGVVAGKRDVSRCRVGDSVRLLAEPENQHDPNAIAVWARWDEQLGYVPATYAASMTASDWTAVIRFVTRHPRTGKPAGLRLRLKRVARSAPKPRPRPQPPGARPDLIPRFAQLLVSPAEK